MARLLLHNAKVYVEKGYFEEAVLTDGGRIVKVGKNNDVLSLSQEGDCIIDCNGRTLIPGINDAHTHLCSTIERIYQANVESAMSIDDIIAACKTFEKENPSVKEKGIFAAGFSPETLNYVFPTKEDLDRISTGYPVIVKSNCGHYMCANTKAIEMIGLTGYTPQLDGGEFMIGEDGEPNGIFKALATNLLAPIIPRFTLDDYAKAFISFQEILFSQGITSIQANDIGFSILDHDKGFELLKKLEAEGKFKLRFRSQTSFKTAEQCEAFVSGSIHVANDYEEDPNITFGGLKLLRDGSITGRTALFRDGYAEDRNNKGVEWHSLPYMRKIFDIGKKYGVPVIVHAMGEQGIDETISLFEETYPDGDNPNRNVLLHCEFTSRDMLDRIIKNNIPVIAQPINIDEDMAFIDAICDKELQQTCFAFGTLMREGAHVSYSSDSPMAGTNPFPNIYTAITRRGLANAHMGEFFPEQKVDREDAIDAFTIESAYVEFLEDCKGRIKEGYYADMVLLSNDIFTCPEEEIPSIFSEMTIVKGEVVYKRKEAEPEHDYITWK